MFGYDQFLVEKKKTIKKTQYIFKFPNGFGASVIRGFGSYGGLIGLWELAVLNEQNKIDYSTEITDDVLGGLSEKEVNEVLTKIKELS